MQAKGRSTCPPEEQRAWLSPWRTLACMCLSPGVWLGQGRWLMQGDLPMTLLDDSNSWWFSCITGEVIGDPTSERLKSRFFLFFSFKKNENQNVKLVIRDVRYCNAQGRQGSRPAYLIHLNPVEKQKYTTSSPIYAETEPNKMTKLKIAKRYTSLYADCPRSSLADEKQKENANT